MTDKPAKDSLYDPPTPTLDTKTKVRLGTMIALLSPVVALCFFMAGLTWQLKELRREVKQLSDEMQASWTISDQLLFAARWKVSNPTHEVPDVRVIVDTLHKHKNP